MRRQEGPIAFTRSMRALWVFVCILTVTACAQHRQPSSRQASFSQLQPASPPPASPSPTPRPNSFGLGSTREEVVAVMGPPRTLQSYASLAKETWSYGQYGASTVDFQNGLVIGWCDAERVFPLNSSLPAQPSPSAYTSRVLSVQPVATTPAPAISYPSSTTPALSSYDGPSYGSSSETYVHGYTRKDGTYVPAHYRTSANGTKFDNWSTRGNTNPHTGRRGYKSPY
jgi:hypothetical protein